LLLLSCFCPSFTLHFNLALLSSRRVSFSALLLHLRPAILLRYPCLPFIPDCPVGEYGLLVPTCEFSLQATGATKRPHEDDEPGEQMPRKRQLLAEAAVPSGVLMFPEGEQPVVQWGCSHLRVSEATELYAGLQQISNLPIDYPDPSQTFELPFPSLNHLVSPFPPRSHFPTSGEKNLRNFGTSGLKSRMIVIAAKRSTSTGAWGMASLICSPL
jgi:hypothetical protein